MSLAIQGIPRTWSLKQVRSHFEHDIPCQFKPLYFNFDSGKFKKTAYIQLLSDRHYPGTIMKNINSNKKNKMLHISATIPKYVSKVLGGNKGPKPKARPKGKFGVAVVTEPDQMMLVTHKEILTELQVKYTRLYNLSRKTPGNELLEHIARIIFERLQTIMETNAEASSTCFKLSGYYRKLHPHFGDFQMVLSTLHEIQDEHGLPRTQLVESDLLAVSSHLHTIDNIPYDKIKGATDKYSVRITRKVLEHIRMLNSDASEGDTEEETARKKVRSELKNMAIHLPSIIRQVIQKNLAPEKAPFHRVRIYGEPFLPSKDLMSPFTRRFSAVHIQRSDRMYNLIKMNIPPTKHSGLIACDGTEVGGAKLVIRSSDVPLYRVSDSLIAEMKAAFGVGHNPGEGFEDNEDIA